jgi:hypothetical protein
MMAPATYLGCSTKIRDADDVCSGALVTSVDLDAKSGMITNHWKIECIKLDKRLGKNLNGWGSGLHIIRGQVLTI